MHDCLRLGRAGRGAESTRLVAPLIALAMVVLVSACGASSPGSASPDSSARPVLPVQISAARIARLPIATTFGKSPGAPRDPDPFEPETGIVLHPTGTRVIYARPGGEPVLTLPSTELGSPTWIPVVQSQPGWDRVLLPTRPNRSTGWIYVRGGGLQTARSSYQVQIDLAAYRLSVFDAHRRLGSWTVAIGAPGTPTPAGRTFLLASLAPSDLTYSPLCFQHATLAPSNTTYSTLILPLGVHSAKLTTFGGG